MNRERAKEILDAGEHLFYHAWCFSSFYMTCGDGCCDDNLNGTEDALDNIERLSNGKWEEVSE